MDTLIDALRFLTGGYFVWSGAAKLHSPHVFWAQIMRYRLVAPGIANVASSAIPPLEFVTGIFFASGLLPRTSGGVLLFLLALFTAALTASLLRGNRPECGCGGRPGAISPALIVRNIGLMICLCIAMQSPGHDYPGTPVVLTLGIITVIMISAGRYRVLTRA
ncbi:MAG: hypothetical protein Q4E05_11880 [Pseudoclavibacter sp.]|nr:hypothetical protein [Pseudoclavibacter sp.]